MLQGIHNILINDGCSKINVAYVSSYSGVDRKLLYYHFGSFPNMISEFLQLEDSQFKEVSVDPNDKQAVAIYLKQRMEQLFEKPVLKQLLAWELSEKILPLKRYASAREKNEIEFIKHILAVREEHGNENDIQALFALLLGGVHYLSAYSQHNTKPFFGINFSDEAQRRHVMDVIAKMLRKLK